jgi:hypothetical protein
MCFVGRLLGNSTKYWFTYQASPADVCFFVRSPSSLYLNFATMPPFRSTSFRRFSSFHA